MYRPQRLAQFQGLLKALRVFRGNHVGDSVCQDKQLVLVGANSVTNAAVGGPLVLGQTYYWKVDESNTNTGRRWSGEVWQFTVRDYVVIDDFESYWGQG